MKSAELIRKLRKVANRRGLPLQIEPGKGSHHKVKLGSTRTIIPMHNAEMGPGLLRSILKDLGLTERELNQ